MAAWTILISDGNLNELLSDIEQLAPYYDLSGIDECGCTTAHSPPPRSSNSPTQPVMRPLAAMSLLDPRTF